MKNVNKIVGETATSWKCRIKIMPPHVNGQVQYHRHRSWDHPLPRTQSYWRFSQGWPGHGYICFSQCQKFFSLSHFSQLYFPQILFKHQKKESMVWIVNQPLLVIWWLCCYTVTSPSHYSTCCYTVTWPSHYNTCCCTVTWPSHQSTCCYTVTWPSHYSTCCFTWTDLHTTVPVVSPDQTTLQYLLFHCDLTFTLQYLLFHLIRPSHYSTCCFTWSDLHTTVPAVAAWDPPCAGSAQHWTWSQHCPQGPTAPTTWWLIAINSSCLDPSRSCFTMESSHNKQVLFHNVIFS